MDLGFNLARLEKLRNNPKQALFYLDEVESISKHYLEWPDTKKCLAKASDLRKEIEPSLS